MRLQYLLYVLPSQFNLLELTNLHRIHLIWTDAMCDTILFILIWSIMYLNQLKQMKIKIKIYENPPKKSIT